MHRRILMLTLYVTAVYSLDGAGQVSLTPVDSMPEPIVHEYGDFWSAIRNLKLNEAKGLAVTESHHQFVEALEHAVSGQ